MCSANGQYFACYSDQIQTTSSPCSNKLHIIFLIWKALNPIVLYHVKSNHTLQLNTRLVQYSDPHCRLAVR